MKCALSTLLLICGLALHAQRTEVKIYNQLYTQDATFDGAGNKVASIDRQSFITNIVEFNMKHDEKRSWWGFEAYIRASKRHAPEDSPLEVLRYEDNIRNARSGLAHIGLKWHWRPKKTIKDLYLKTLLLVPTNNTAPPNTGAVPFIDDTGYQYFLQLNYHHKIAKQVYGYYEFGGWWRFERKVAPRDDFILPAKAFITYFPVSDVGIYGYATALPTLSSPDSQIYQFGGGVKVFPSEHWALEIAGGSFPFGRSAGAGYNIDMSITYAWNRKLKK